jgi:hypothetical protein
MIKTHLAGTAAGFTLGSAAIADTLLGFAAPANASSE